MRRVLILLILLFTARTSYAQRPTPTDVAGIAKALLSRCGEGQVLVKDSTVQGGVRCATPGSGGGTPSAPVNAVQFNDAGSFGGDAGLTYTKTTNTLSVGVTNPAVSIATTGGGDGVFYDYYVYATLSDGSTTGSAYVDTDDGPSTLDVTHYNQISWTAVTGAVNYTIFTDERDGTPSSIGILGTVGSGVLTFRDNGVTGDGNNDPYTNNTTGTTAIHSIVADSVDGLVLDGYIKTLGSGTVAQDTGRNQFRYTDLRTETVPTGSFLTASSPYLIGNTTTKNRKMAASYGSTWVRGGGAELATIFWGLPVVDGPTDVFANYYAAAPVVTPGALTTYASYWSEDLGAGGATATNPYVFWYDGAGSDCNGSAVTRINGFGIFGYYNPCFPHYTPAAPDFQRIILRWGDTGVFGTDNIAYLGVEAGGTGAPAPALELIGGGLRFNATLVTPASSGTRYLCISTAGVVTSSASACSGT